MTDDEWTLDPESEAEKLTPCLADLDDATERRVMEWVAAVVRNPLGRKPDRENLWSVKVPKTDVTLVWTLDPEKKVVVILNCRPG